ncbi:MAG: DNA helicase [Pseudomonadota bacterium]
MRLSAPIYLLKRRAKLLARQNGIPLHKALNQVAVQEGFRSWSLLASSIQSPSRSILTNLNSGDLVLLAARPGHGKTLLGLELASKAEEINRKGYFFTLDYHERDIARQFETLGIHPSAQMAVVINTSDDISTSYIIEQLKYEREPTIIVIDYLQLLDQKRSNPCLSDQIKSLKRYVLDNGSVCAVISQIDRRFDMEDKSMPGMSDVRLPNPLDLNAFNKAFFLHNGAIQMVQAA